MLPGCPGLEVSCKQNILSCEELIPQGEALPPPHDLIVLLLLTILRFLYCLSLLSAVTKGRLAAFTKHDKHKVARMRRLFPVGSEFTRTITWFLTNPKT